MKEANDISSGPVRGERVRTATGASEGWQARTDAWKERMARWGLTRWAAVVRRYGQVQDGGPKEGPEPRAPAKSKGGNAQEGLRASRTPSDRKGNRPELGRAQGGARMGDAGRVVGPDDLEGSKAGDRRMVRRWGW